MASLKELKSVVSDLNKIYDEEDQIAIASGIKKKELETGVKSLSEDLDADDLNELSVDTVSFLKENGYIEHLDLEEEETEEDEEEETEEEDEEDEEEETEEESVLNLKQIVEGVGDLTKLKKIVKENPNSFPNAKKGVHFNKDLEKLREKALNDLNGEIPEKKEKPKSTSKKEKGYTRMDAICDALKQNPETKDEWVKMSDDIMREKGKETNSAAAKTLMSYAIITLNHFAQKDVIVPEN